MKWFIVILILSIALIAGCSGSNVDGNVSCDPPYITDGTGCCLDENKDGICDSDETNSNEALIEESCMNSGGTVTTQLCCKSVNNFPDTCLIGACGCSPDNSHEVKVCDCGEENCWDGDSCELFGTE